MDKDHLLQCPKLDHNSKELPKLYWDARRLMEWIQDLPLDNNNNNLKMEEKKKNSSEMQLFTNQHNFIYQKTQNFNKTVRILNLVTIFSSSRN